MFVAQGAGRRSLFLTIPSVRACLSADRSHKQDLLDSPSLRTAFATKKIPVRDRHYVSMQKDHPKGRLLCMAPGAGLEPATL